MPAGNATVTFSNLAIDENTPPGTLIGTVTIDEPDGILTATIGGSINGQNSDLYMQVVDNGDGTYSLLTGEIAFDFEALTSQELYVYFMDFEGNEETIPFALIVNDIVESSPPVANDDTTSAGKNIRTTIDVLANDTDSDGTIDPTTVTVVDGPDHGTFSVNATTGVITYTPTKDYVGSDSFTYTVRDNDGNVSGEATVTIDVASKLTLTSANEAFAADAVAIGTVEVDGGAGDDYLSGSSNPSTAGADKFYGGDGNDIIFGATGNDYIEGNAGNDYLRSGSGNDTLVGGEGNDTYGIRIFANKTSSTVDTGTVTIIDDDGVLWNGAPRPATVPTEWSSQPPAAAGYQITGTATISGEGTWNLVIADDNGGTKTLSLFMDGGDLWISGGNENVIVKDYVNGKFGITLDGVVVPTPTATADTAATVKDLSKTIDVLANDTDADGTLDPTTVTIVDGPLHGTLTVDATTGVITYKPITGYVGADSFTYTVKDDAGNTSNVASVTLDVAAAHILTSGDDVFSGDSKGLTASGIEVHGGAGDDYIVTSNQAAMPDTIYGDDGNDLIFTGRGNDYVEGGDGNDVIHARAGNDTVIGGAGDDTYVVRFTDTGTTTITDDDGTLFHGTFTPASIPTAWTAVPGGTPGATNGFGISGEATIVSEGVWSLTVTETSGTAHTLTLTLTDGDLSIVESGKPQTVVIKDYVNGTFGITLASENHAPRNLALSNDNVDENSEAGTVVGTLSATDPEGGAVTYTLAQPSDYFEIVGNEIRVKGALDYEAIASHDLTVVASDADGNTTQQTFEIGVNDLDEAPTEPSKGTITIDVSGSGTTGVDFEAYVRGGFISDTVGGGFPSFDNSSAFAGEEMFIGYGSDALSKYVLAHGNLEYSFGTHTIAGEINTIEFGMRGTGSFDSNGYFTGGNSLLKITGLTFANGVPTNSTEEAQIEANGLVHLFGIAHMYGNSTDPDTAAKVAAALDKIADGLDAYAQHFIGSAGADIYVGTGYGDEIEGGAGNDLLSGGGGDDVVTGGAGSDIIAGGFGSDTATYSELKSAYTVTDNEDGTFTVLDTVAGTSDTLSGVEFLRFKDVIVDLSDGSETPVGEPPEDIQLSASTVAENAAVGTVVGTLSAVDPDGGTVSFALTGAVSDKFEIVGNELRLKAGVDFETAQSHDITVRVTDSFGSTTDKTFTIGVTDVNEAPVSLALSKTSVAESAAVGTVVGTLSATDPEGGVLTYTLGADTDGKFEIVGNQLRVKAGLDYEADNSHPITVIVKDAAGNSTSKSFTIKVTNIDEAPGSVTLSKATVAENAAVGTTVGTLSAVDPEGGEVVYSLSSNPGGMFKIVDNKLQVAKALNYETGASYTIKVDAIDVGGNTTVKTFTIGVTDINEAPGSVALSKATVAENSAVGTTIGTLSAVDPEGKALTYKLTDNAGGLFKLDGNKLQLAKSVDYETLKSDTITVEVKDAGGLMVTKTFTIGVTDVNEAPGSVTLSKATVAENTKVGTTVGTFSAIDPEGKALTYKLTDNAGGLFKLDGNKLQVAKGIDYESVQGDTIKVEVKDAGGLTVIKTFTIGVTDVLETITGTSSSQTLRGDIGADKIAAGAGNDTLMGYAGNDLLYGDAGNDTVYGGLGADDLTGGAGKDTFLFKTLGDSTVSSSGRDTIFDFSGTGGDRIDLSTIDASTKTSGDQAFSFLGTASFTGKAGELRYEKEASDTYVYADVNGDKKADFAIHLDDAVTLTKGYFVL